MAYSDEYDPGEEVETCASCHNEPGPYWCSECRIYLCLACLVVFNHKGAAYLTHMMGEPVAEMDRLRRMEEQCQRDNQNRRIREQAANSSTRL